MSRSKQIFTVLGVLATVLLCCGGSYWLVTLLWNSLGTVVQQWVLGALAVLVGYQVIGIIFGIMLLAGVIAIVVWAINK